MIKKAATPEGYSEGMLTLLFPVYFDDPTTLSPALIKSDLLNRNLGKRKAMFSKNNHAVYIFICGLRYLRPIQTLCG